jgi:phosphoserine phosphatase RsbU/P
MRKIFYFIARKTNYSTAIAISTSLLNIFIIISELILLNIFLASVYEEITRFIEILRQPYIFIIIMLLHCIIFGLLSFVKIPAFFKFLRIINVNINGSVIYPEIKDEDLKKVYNNLTNLPVYNMIMDIILMILGGLAIFLISYYDIKDYGELFMELLVEYLKIFIFLHTFIIVVSALGTYVITDAITNRERAACFNELRIRKLIDRPKSYLKLQIKFVVIIVIMFIALLNFWLLVQEGNLGSNIDLSGYIIYFLAATLAAMIIITTTAHSILRVFGDISRVAQDITKGSGAKFDILPLEREFVDVEYLVLEMDQEIIGHRRNLEAKVEERTAELRKALSNLKERDDLIQKQLDMAGTIQRGILPGKINDWNELKFAVKYFSMDKIGGDFYDFHQIENNRIAIYIADVSGHGIPAALVTTMAKVSFGNAFLKYDSPKKIFREVNQELLDHVKTQDYLTCFMILIDDEYNVTYSNASHQKAILLRSTENRIERLDTNGLFIGAIEDARETYEEKTTKLNYGDRIILYTDGIPEAMNANREDYSNDRFEKIILHSKDLELREFTNYIIDDLQNFTGGSQIQDDITLLVIELKRDETVDLIKNSINLSNQKRYFEAIDLLREGLELFPDNQRLLYTLAKTYFKANDFRKVVVTIKKYAERDIENKFAFYLAGAAAFKLSDFEDAIEFFQKALGLDPNFVNALFALGMSYKESGLKEDASRCFEKLKNIDEDNKFVDYELTQLKST